MKIFALIAALLLTASPAAAQVATSLSQQQLGGQSIQSAGTEAPRTGVFCSEEMTATFCNVPSGPSEGRYGSRGVSTSSKRGWIERRVCIGWQRWGRQFVHAAMRKRAAIQRTVQLTKQANQCTCWVSYRNLLVIPPSYDGHSSGR